MSADQSWLATKEHPVLHTPLGLAPADANELIYFAAGCFWGVERIFWRLPGVVSTAVGYMGGRTTDPSYVQVCTGLTGHAETVRVIYDPSRIRSSQLIATFFENHDSTQLNRQGNDLGTQYRSAIWTTNPHQEVAAHNVVDTYQKELTAAGLGTITTTIEPAESPFYFAEEYHQAYLFKNPAGYCNHGFNGIPCPGSDTP